MIGISVAISRREPAMRGRARRQSNGIIYPLFGRAGFDYVEQYQQNIPSFGQWGWTIATKMGQSPSTRISNVTDMPVPSRWISKKYLLASFAFPNNYFEQVNDITFEMPAQSYGYLKHILTPQCFVVTVQCHLAPQGRSPRYFD